MATPNQTTAAKTTANNGAKAARAKKPRVTAAQRAEARSVAFNAAIQKAAKRVEFCDAPPAGATASVIACATVNSVMQSVAAALRTGRLSADAVLSANAAFLNAAGVEEVEAPMGGTTFQRRAE